MAIGGQTLGPQRKFQAASVSQTDRINQQTLQIVIGFAPVGQEFIPFEAIRGMTSAPISAQKTEIGPAVAQEWYVDESLVCTAIQSPWRSKGVHVGLTGRYLATLIHHSPLVYSDISRLESSEFFRRLMTESFESCQHLAFNLDLIALGGPYDLVGAFSQQIGLPEGESLPVYFAEHQAILNMSEAQENQESETADEIDSSRVKPHLVHDGSDE